MITLQLTPAELVVVSAALATERARSARKVHEMEVNGVVDLNSRETDLVTQQDIDEQQAWTQRVTDTETKINEAWTPECYLAM